MPTVQNVTDPPRPVDLTGGAVLAPRELAIVDTALPHEADQIARGNLRVVDPDTLPPPTVAEEFLAGVFAGAAQGDVIIRGADGWKRVPAGSTGRVLTTRGSGQDAEWSRVDVPDLDFDVATQTELDAVAAARAQALAATTVKTAAYAAAAGDLIPVDATAGSVTVTLPTAPADKTRIAVKLIAVSGTNTVTIARGGTTDVFNKAGGGTSLTLKLLNEAVSLQYVAATGVWYVQSTDVPLTQLDARYPQKSTSSGDQGKFLDAYTGLPHAVDSAVDFRISHSAKIGNATDADYAFTQDFNTDGAIELPFAIKGYHGDQSGEYAVSGRPQLAAFFDFYRVPTTDDSAECGSGGAFLTHRSQAHADAGQLTQAQGLVGWEGDAVAQGRWHTTSWIAGLVGSVEGQNLYGYSPTIDKAAGVYVGAKGARDAGVTISKWYGLFVEDPTASGALGAITNRWGAYFRGSGAHVHTEGELRIGSSTGELDSTQRASLSYSGGVNGFFTVDKNVQPADGKFFRTVITAAGEAFRNRLVTTDTQPAFHILGDGSLEWGPGGSTAVDTTLHRTSAGTLRLLGTLSASGALATDSDANVAGNANLVGGASAVLMRAMTGAGSVQYAQRVTGGSFDRFNIFGNGAMNWGGGSVATDVNLYRNSAVDRLKTDDHFQAALGVATMEINSTGLSTGGIDALWTTGAPPNGTVVSDPTNHLILKRDGGAWYKSAAYTAV